MIESSRSQNPALVPGINHTMEADMPSDTAGAGMGPRLSFQNRVACLPSHIITYNDGLTDLFALSLSKVLVAEYQAIIDYCELNNDIKSKLQLVREEMSASKSQLSRPGYTEEEPLQVEHPMLTKGQIRNDKLEHDILAVDSKIKRLSSEFRQGIETGFTKAVMKILSSTKTRPSSKLALPEIYFIAMSKRRRETRRSRDMFRGSTTKTRGHGYLILYSVDSGACIESWGVSSPSSALPYLLESGTVPDNWHSRQPRTLLEILDAAAVQNSADEAEPDGDKKLTTDEKSTATEAGTRT